MKLRNFFAQSQQFKFTKLESTYHQLKNTFTRVKLFEKFEVRSERGIRKSKYRIQQNRIFCYNERNENEFVLIGEIGDERSNTLSRDGFGVTKVHEGFEARRRLAAWSRCARAGF